MINQDIARILHEIAIYLEMEGVAFKPRAYEKAADTITGLAESLHDIYTRGGLRALEKIPGVGVSIAEKIAEFLKTGKMKYYTDLKKKFPLDIPSFMNIAGVGPKTLVTLYKKLGIRTVRDLERAARRGTIKNLPGFGVKSEENILKSLAFASISGKRFVLGLIMPLLRDLEMRLHSISGVERVMLAGSARRRKETIGDADFLIVARKPKLVMDFFTTLPEARRVYAHGETKSSIQLANGLDVDVRVVPAKSYGAALHYFTGSKEHNVALRERAIKKGYTLNEYGLFSSESGKNADLRKSKPRLTQTEIWIAGKTEEEIYEKLGMDYIEPEMRENWGEIELAKEHTLPKLISYGDLKGDLQVQTSWTDGRDSVWDMAIAAARYGLEYIAITDHTKKLAVTHGLDEKRIISQWKEIDDVNRKLRDKNYKLKVLKGTECDILKDGTLDLPDFILSKLDVVGVSVHSSFTLSRADQTERIARAIENPHVDILFHPTGRVINKRPPYEVDIDLIIRTARKAGTVLEIDAYPDRLDLCDEYIRKAIEAGVKCTIDSDAHTTGHLTYLEYGVAQARRGWATARDIINTKPLQQMLRLLKH